MLLQIMPEQVIQFKSVIEDAVNSAIPKIPGESRSKMNNIIKLLLLGEMIGWIVYRKLDGGSKESIGFMITKIMYDDITETKSVLIYCLHTYSNATDKEWEEGFNALLKYGVKHGCVRISGYVSLDYLIDKVEYFGGTVEQFISVPFRDKFPIGVH